MESTGAIFAFMKDALPLLLAGLMILGPALIFMMFLRFFRKTRLAFGRCITCPEKKQRASVQFIGLLGEKGPYRDVAHCSLLDEEKKVTCQKACLLSREVLEVPFASEEKRERTSEG